MKHFQKLLQFQEFLRDYNKIYRDLESIHTTKLPDNDVEHSFRVAMLAWMLVEEFKLKLNVKKILQYALVHDLVEIYAGDISIYKNYKQADKEKKEHASLQKIKKKFPGLKSIWKLIESYELRKDKESRFVYIIEKLEPIFLVITSANDHWTKRGISYDIFLELKQKKIKHIDSYAQIFNKETMAYLKKHHKRFFIALYR